MNNIICSGALFYSASTKRFLFLQRTSAKTKSQWGIVGGTHRDTESIIEGLKREVVEEIGCLPEYKKIIPLELFTSNDEKFQFNTYVICVDNEFIPTLNTEHSSYAWCAYNCWPMPLHSGLKNTLNNKSIQEKIQTILNLSIS